MITIFKIKNGCDIIIDIFHANYIEEKKSFMKINLLIICEKKIRVTRIETARLHI